MSATDVPAGAAQPDALRAERVHIIAKQAEDPRGEFGPPGRASVAALAASHELLRARATEWERLYAGAALAGGRAADVLRRIVNETYPAGWSRESCMALARAGVQAYDAETGGGT